MQLTPRHLSEKSQLKYEYFSCNLPPYEHDEVLVVVFKGECGYGCNCYSDCAFMTAMIKAGVEAFHPLVLILDLSRLTYEWGDEMADVLVAARDRYLGVEFPIAVIVSDRCREGLTSLVKDEMNVGNPEDWLFDDWSSAFDAVVRKYRVLTKTDA